MSQSFIQKELAVVTPVFNDWIAFQYLLNDFVSFSTSTGIHIHIIAVDDCSSILPSQETNFAHHLVRVEVIRLATNLGHQRAIAVGLCHAYKLKNACDVVVMDSDGEDRVPDIQYFLSDYSNDNIAVASRKSRTDNFRFRFFYQIYKLVFSLLTGIFIDFGNFMYIPYSKLHVLITMPDVWNHLAASVLKSKIPIKRLGIPRGKRYCGKSKMNFFNLALHGLAAISVFIDLIFMRILVLLVFLVFVFFILMVIVFYFKFFTLLAIPGWATNVVCLLLLAIMQSTFILLVLTFSLLSSRTSRQFVPAHDSYLFVR